MKKLNRKGFTLVELLAVIIILAIVVGITIPSITNIINDSKNNALEVALNAAEDYLSDQYAYMNIDYNTATDAFTSAFNGAEGTKVDIKDQLLKETGLSKDNVTSVVAKVDFNGTFCVQVVSIPQTSEYYSTTYWNSTEPATPKVDKGVSYLSKSCGGTPINTNGQQNNNTPTE